MKLLTPLLVQSIEMEIEAYLETLKKIVSIHSLVFVTQCLHHFIITVRLNICKHKVNIIADSNKLKRRCGMSANEKTLQPSINVLKFIS